MHLRAQVSLRTVAAAPSAEATAAASASTINRVNGREAEPPIDTIEQLASEPDPEVREESHRPAGCVGR